MQDTILAIAGKPGLYKLVARGNANLIVEAIDGSRRRIPAGARDRVTSLNDVSMYTDSNDVPLMRVFQNIADALGGAPTDFRHKDVAEDRLEQFMSEIALPAWDKDRVHTSDIRKLVQWYNILVNAGYKQFFAPVEVALADEAAAPAADTNDETPETAAPAKKKTASRTKKSAKIEA